MREIGEPQAKRKEMQVKRKSSQNISKPKHKPVKCKQVKIEECKEMKHGGEAVIATEK